MKASSFVLISELLLSINFGHSFHLARRTQPSGRWDTRLGSGRQEEGNGTLESYTKNLGDAALKRVEWLGSLVSGTDDDEIEEKGKVGGTGGAVYTSPTLTQITGRIEEAKAQQVWAALATLEKDMQSLDQIEGEKSQLSPLEATLLVSAVLSAAGSPIFLGGRITEFLAPSAAAFVAAIGIGAEFTGKVAVADGKEIAAAAIQCAAEAEGLLANAERAKAVIPLCVGIGATSASFALLVPVLLDSLSVRNNLQLITEIYLLCPLVAVLAAAVATLALQETRSYANRAIGTGNRRFARSGIVGRTWLSASEQVDRNSAVAVDKWKAFSFSVLPAPLLGALVPGALPTKTIVVAAFAAAQSAYFLTQAENVLSKATDAVALKARSAAVCDTYANQGARSAAVLPFTSALSSLCAAATAALVELPFVEALAATHTASSVAAETVFVSLFPALSAILAAAASVSKARCRVDAEAAKQAACTLALQYNDEKGDPVISPLQATIELVRLTIRSSITAPFRRLLTRLGVRRTWRQLVRRLRRGGSGRNGSSSTISRLSPRPQGL